ncbi:MAG: hypothetical protein R3A78_06640 [Polyangiales bacterium]
MKLRLIGLGLLCALAAYGCDDDSNKVTGDAAVGKDGGEMDSGDVDAGSDAGEDAGETSSDKNVSKNVKADEGASIDNEDLNLNIPPDALPENKTISVNGLDEETLPEKARLLSEAFELGPDGTTFDLPVKLTFSNVTIPGGKFVDVAFLTESNEWEALPFTDVNGTTVTSWTTHFTKFAVVLRDGELFGGACDQDFDACGGDVTGDWQIDEDVCATFSVSSLVGDLPEGCTGVTGTGEFETGGYFSFLPPFSPGDDQAGFWSGGFGYQVYYNVPNTCFENSTCPEAYEPNGAMCDNSASTESSFPFPEYTGHWGTENGTLYFIELVEGEQGVEDGPRYAAQYCVNTMGDQDPENDTLTVRFPTAGGGAHEVVIRASRYTQEQQF